MRQNATLKKMYSYLCVIDTINFRTRFLIMRHNYKSASARCWVYWYAIRVGDMLQVRTYVRKSSTRCHIQKVPQLPKWPLLQLTTSTYIGSAYSTSGSGTPADHWRNPGNCSRAGQPARSLRCGGVPSSVLARVHPWVSFEKSWLSFRLSCTPWLYTIDCGFCDTS